MLIGSFFSSCIAFYLNSYYSGPFLGYSSKEQIKDILPSFGIALLMAGPVFAMSFIDVSHFLLLSSQIITGAIITIITCETSKLPEYLELKSIVLSKFSHNKDSLNT